MTPAVCVFSCVCVCVFCGLWGAGAHCDIIFYCSGGRRQYVGGDGRERARTFGFCYGAGVREHGCGRVGIESGGKRLLVADGV